MVYVSFALWLRHAGWLGSTNALSPISQTICRSISYINTELIVSLAFDATTLRFLIHGVLLIAILKPRSAIFSHGNPFGSSLRPAGIAMNS